jgi:hypothetical protein
MSYYSVPLLGRPYLTRLDMPLHPKTSILLELIRGKSSQNKYAKEPKAKSTEPVCLAVPQPVN